MKYQRHFKDCKIRQETKKIELAKRIAKVLHFSFKKNTLQWVLVKDKKFKSKFFQTQVKRFCIISGRSKGVFKKFKVSRMLIRELSGKSHFFGLKKASW